MHCRYLTSSSVTGGGGSCGSRLFFSGSSVLLFVSFPGHRLPVEFGTRPACRPFTSLRSWGALNGTPYL